MQQIEYIDIAKLKMHPNNPRVIRDAQFKILCDSLRINKDYFETRPILCNKDMVIFAGNMRYRAAKEVGIKQVPVAVMDISEARQKELMIRDNRQNGEWDFDALANNFEVSELVDWGFDEKELNIKFDIEEDEVPEVPKEAKSKLGDIYQLGGHVVCPKCGMKYDLT